MSVIYTNFDTFELAYQGAIPPHILDRLKEAKQLAQKEGEKQTVKFGDITIRIQSSGNNRGYSYIFSTGSTGITVCVKHSTKPKDWNLFVSVGSACLATRGLQGALDHIREVFNNLQAIGMNRKRGIEQEPFDTLVESINRVDYCMDVIANDFEIIVEHFVAHARTQKKPYWPESNGVTRGNSAESILIGKMPNKEVIVYNKTREIISKRKAYWYDIWNESAKKHNAAPPVKGKDTVWRFEVRICKKAFEKLRLKTLKQLHERLPDIYAAHLQSCRMVSEKTGKNPTRWPVHPLWKLFQEKAKDCFSNESVVMPETLIADLTRSQREEMMENALYGTLISYTALRGGSLETIEEIMESFEKRFEAHLVHRANDAAKKFYHAKERYAHL